MPSDQLLYYPSRLDGTLQPLPLSVTDDGSEAKALILDVSPGAISDLSSSVSRCGEMARVVAAGGESAVVAKPCGRGPGSVYQGPGEVDFFEAVEFIRRSFRIDPDRISVTGGSMGGAATWYLASHYPDVFAAAAPFCGYCDYRLWVKPGGTIIRTHEWEHHSWQARGAAFRVGNLSRISLWIVHGEWDTPIGGGVSVQHSRNMVRRLGELGIPHRYTEVPECGHGCMTESLQREVLPWLARQRRESCPPSVDLTAHTLRHNRSFYLCLDAFEHYGAAARATAELREDTLMVRWVENVAVLTLGPVPERSPLRVEVEGAAVGEFDLSIPVAFAKSSDGWRPLGQGARAAEEKRHGCSGPVGDIFFEPIRIVQGTQGTQEENFIIEWLAGEWVSQFMKRNGGVHRGIFDGQSHYRMEIVRDTEISEAELESCNLILAGTQRSNAVYERIADRLPISFGERAVRIGEQRFDGKEPGALLLTPSPFNGERYTVIIGGATPRAIAGSSHLNLQLLPDYVVWDGQHVPTWGFFNGTWGL